MHTGTARNEQGLTAREVVRSALDGLRVGEATRHGGLTVVGLQCDGASLPIEPALEYVPFAHALREGRARVMEVSETGSVQEVCVVNDGDVPVLLLGGEELVGARQNRAVNLSVLVPSHSQLAVPVSCVEQQRWRYRTQQFAASRYVLYAELRARSLSDVSASLRQGRHTSDQGAVWESIAAKCQRLGTRSPTGAMHDLYDAHRAAVDEVTAAVQPGADQIGVVFASDERVVVCDVFDSPATLAAYWPALVASYTLGSGVTQSGDLASAPPGASHPRRTPDGQRARARALLEELARAEAHEYPALGLGTDVRLHSPDVHGAGVVVKTHAVHVTAFTSSL